MKKLLFISIFATLSVSNAQNFTYGQKLTGETKLSCEALLCLPSPVKPSECIPSINYYFGLSAKKWSGVLTKRRNFLNLCPLSSDSNDNLLSSIGIDPNQQEKDMNGFKNTVLDMPHDCMANTLNKQVEKRKETRSIWEAYVERLDAIKKMNPIQKRRMLNAYDADDKSTVYRVKTSIPAACERFYQHSWTPERPIHNKDYNWYYEGELKNKLPPAVWK